MSIGSRNCENTASFAKELITFALGTTAVSQTAKVTQRVTIPFAFEVVSVEAYGLTVTATITLDCFIAGVTCLAAPITPVADTKVAGTLSATKSARQSKVAAELAIAYTSNGSGAATNCGLTVVVRPLGMHGDAYRAAP